jgi:hypothetical protein
MGKAIFIFSIILIFFFVACEHKNGKKVAVGNHSDSLKTLANKTELERLEKRRLIEEQESVDSLNNTKILDEAIKLAEQYKEIDRFKKSYVSTMPDSSYQVGVELSSDFYFTKQYPHLIIRRMSPGSVYVDIFSKANKQFQKVLSNELWALEYTGDTIRDINGDNMNDFVVNRYGSSGCCLKAFSKVYLLSSNKKSFSNSFEFINPTFSPKEHLVRGVCYGHPGETEMYKYKWNKEAVDTVEYVYYEKNDRGKRQES